MTSTQTDGEGIDRRSYGDQTGRRPQASAPEEA